MNFVPDMIEEKLLALRTAFIGKVLAYDGNTAKIQPLSMIKPRGGTAFAPSPLDGVPVINSARYKADAAEVEYVDTVSGGADNMHVTTQKRTLAELKPLSAGDIVFCMCADRDITETRKGNVSVPSIRHHDLSDAVIVGVL